MPHTYSSLLTHLIYSTKDRRPLIDSELEGRLFPYLAGIIRQLGGKLYQGDGTEDHVHLLAELPASISIAEAVGKIKGNSSHWIHQSFPDRGSFAWQRGYAAFSVSKSSAATVASYIQGQKKHHQKRSFEQEYVRLLQRHGVPLDMKYLWA